MQLLGMMGFQRHPPRCHVGFAFWNSCTPLNTTALNRHWRLEEGHLRGPEPGVAHAPVAHRVQDGPPGLVEGVAHGGVAVDDPVGGGRPAVVVLEVVYLPARKGLRVLRLVAAAACRRTRMASWFWWVCGRRGGGVEALLVGGETGSPSLRHADAVLAWSA